MDSESSSSYHSHTTSPKLKMYKTKEISGAFCPSVSQNMLQFLSPSRDIFNEGFHLSLK